MVVILVTWLAENHAVDKEIALLTVSVSRRSSVDCRLDKGIDC